MSIHNNTLRLKGLKAIAEALPDFTYGDCYIEENTAGGLTYDVDIRDVSEGAKISEFVVSSDPVVIGELNLPNVVNLRGYAFYSSDSTITKLTAPKLKKVGYYAFYNNYNLRLDALPDSIEEIQYNGFYLCSNLTFSTLPTNLKIIGERAFYGCHGLKSVTFKSTPTSISTLAFEGCSQLRTIKVPWASGEIPGAPWGASNAKVTYNYTEE